MFFNQNKIGFTLAEILITIGIIGAVAALTLPTLITNIYNKVRKQQITVFEKKINNATDKMHVDGKLGPYYSSTKDFVTELSNSLKIVSICSPRDGISLDKCWTYSEVNNDDGTTFDVNDSISGESTFNVSSSYMETVGIILGNGTPMLLSFNKDCNSFDPESTYEEGSTSSCIAGVYDINGPSGPNKYGKDIISFNANGFGDSCYIKIGSVCLPAAPAFTTSIMPDDCLQLKSEGKLEIDRCCTTEWCYRWGDYYAGAALHCGGQSKLIDKSQLITVLRQLYSGAQLTSSYAWSNNLIINENSDAYAYLTNVIGTSDTSRVWTKEVGNKNQWASDWRIHPNRTLSYEDNRHQRAWTICTF